MKALVLLLLLVGCAPTEQDCRALMPIAGEAVTISTTTSGTMGCTTNVEGVMVTTELRCEGLHWRAGQTLANGKITPPGEVRASIAAIKARRGVEARIRAAGAAAATTSPKCKRSGSNC